VVVIHSYRDNVTGFNDLKDEMQCCWDDLSQGLIDHVAWGRRVNTKPNHQPLRCLLTAHVQSVLLCIVFANIHCTLCSMSNYCSNILKAKIWKHTNSWPLLTHKVENFTNSKWLVLQCWILSVPSIGTLSTTMIDMIFCALHAKTTLLMRWHIKYRLDLLVAVSKFI